MFYDPRKNLRPDPLRHNPVNTLVAPRPIGWVSTISGTGVANLAPFSYFNAVSSDPVMVMFAPHDRSPGVAKDTWRNLTEVPEFVVNVVSFELKDAMNQSSASYLPQVDEFEALDLARAASRNVRPPRLAAATAALECVVYRTVDLPRGRDGRDGHVVVGEVVGIHIDETLINADGAVEQLALAQVARLGKNDYLSVEKIFTMPRPD